MQTRTILPIIAVLVGILLVNASVMAESAADKLNAQLNQIAELPAGTEFTLSITSEDATEIASEYLNKYRGKLNEFIKKYANVSLDVSDPSISFNDGLASLAVSAGKGFLKAKAEIDAALSFDGSRLVIKTQTIKVPLIQLDPAQVDSTLQSLADQFIPTVLYQYEVKDFSIADGVISVTAIKK